MYANECKFHCVYKQLNLALCILQTLQTSKVMSFHNVLFPGGACFHVNLAALCSGMVDHNDDTPV